MRKERISRRRSQIKNQGFTLIEIMVVVVIIAIMAGVAAPLVISRIHDANVAAAKQDIKTFSGALDMYKLDNYKYPTEDEGLNALVTKPSSAGNRWKKYIKELPKDPWGNAYSYTIEGSEYEIISYGADGQPGGTEEAKDITLYGDEE